MLKNLLPFGRGSTIVYLAPEAELLPPPDLPEEARQELRARNQRSRRRRYRYLLRRSQRMAIWAIIGAFVAYAVATLLTDDTQVRHAYAAGGVLTTLFVKWRRWGRFGGMLFYGLPLTSASYLGHHYEIYDPERVTTVILYCVSGVALITGALVGLSEEIVSSDR